MWRILTNSLDLELGKGDQVGLLLSVAQLEPKQTVSDLLDRDSPSRERGLLCAVSLVGDTSLLVLEDVGGDGRVVRDLLSPEREITVGVSSEELLPEDRVQRLLL